MTPSWPERYEEAYATAWTGELGNPPVSWGDCINDAAGFANEFLVAHATSGQPSKEAVHVLAALHDDLRGTGSEDMAIAEALHPRFLGVFCSLPRVEALRDQIGELGRFMWSLQGATDMPDDIAEALGHIELHHQHAVIQWVHYGRRVFVLGEHTASLLARTDLPNMPVGDLRFPFRAFYLRLPRGMYRLEQPGGKTHSVDGVMVTTDRTDADSPYVRQLTITVCPDSVIQPGGASPWAFTLSAADRSLREVAADLHAMLVGDEGARMLRLTGDFDPIENLVLGFALYLMSEHPLLEAVPGQNQPRGRANATAPRVPVSSKRAGRRTRLGYVKVGREDAPDSSPRLRQVAGSEPSLDKLVWVRGHWRRQAHGEHYALRKTIWIEPHTRGPDVAEQIGNAVARAGRVQDAMPRQDVKH